MSDLDPRTQQAIADGEAAWLKASSGNWDESAWRIMGTALTLLRQEVLRFSQIPRSAQRTKRL
jgi:hypothetical protein